MATKRPDIGRSCGHKVALTSSLFIYNAYALLTHPSSLSPLYHPHELPSPDLLVAEARFSLSYTVPGAKQASATYSLN
jgi:hypothetical protein